MRTLMTFMTVLSLVACTQKKEEHVAAGSATASPPVAKPVSANSAAVGSAAAPSGSGSTTAPSDSDGADEVAQLVVHDVGSPALGKQTIEASCVTVAIVPSGDWTVGAARLKDCGDKNARSILWLYKRAKMGGKWSEDYVGQPPKCWKGVPADIVDAVKIATRIPSC